MYRSNDDTSPASPVWDPTVYGAFADDRSRPFFDLLARVGAVAPRKVVDLGCGPGELTATLADRWPGATVVGVDNSPDMLAAAESHGSQRVSFRLGDLADHLPDGDVDVVVSNAAYQWVPDHGAILRRIAERLPAGGWLAVQVPGNFDAPSHRAIRELVGQPKWQRLTGGLQLRADPVLSPAAYAGLVMAAGLRADVWETTYQQVLTGEDPVLTWVSGTALRPVLTALPPARQQDFLDELAPRLRAAYPQTAGPAGPVTVFGFRRIFLVGHRTD